MCLAFLFYPFSQFEPFVVFCFDVLVFGDSPGAWKYGPVGVVEGSSSCESPKNVAPRYLSDRSVGPSSQGDMSVGM